MGLVLVVSVLASTVLVQCVYPGFWWTGFCSRVFMARVLVQGFGVQSFIAQSWDPHVSYYHKRKVKSSQVGLRVALIESVQVSYAMHRLSGTLGHVSGVHRADFHTIQLQMNSSAATSAVATGLQMICCK